MYLHGQKGGKSMDYYSITKEQAQKLINCLEKYRKQETMVQYTGNDYNEKEEKIFYRYPYYIYGDERHCYLMVVGNSFSLNIMYDRYRVAYTLQAPDGWSNVDVASYGDDFYNDIHPKEALSDRGIDFMKTCIKDAFTKGGMSKTILAKSKNYLQGMLTDESEPITDFKYYSDDLPFN